MTLAEGDLGKDYTVVGITTNDEELDDFLFTLGCYSGESIVIVSKISGSYVISIRDSRYNIDQDLAESILITQN